MSHKKNHETEVKLRVDDLDAIRQRLEALGATLTHPRVYERNVRYENDDETLTPEGKVVRLREDSRVRLTYKGPNQVVNGIGNREEYEIEVSDFKTAEIILYQLGYHAHMVYEKYRTTYEHEGAEIVLDEMPFGNFIEIEGDVKDIENLITMLELAHVPRMGRSYSSLFVSVKYHLNLNFRALTFDNFDGIDVPDTAFKPINS